MSDYQNSTTPPHEIVPRKYCAFNRFVSPFIHLITWTRSAAHNCWEYLGVDISFKDEISLIEGIAVSIILLMYAEACCAHLVAIVVRGILLDDRKVQIRAINCVVDFQKLS